MLHEEDGLYGVFDRAGPQIYFAADRAEAVREVARANEIVRLHPNTISMRHLREMDAEWRRDHGLPPLPEPEGRTILVSAEATRARPSSARRSPVAPATPPNDVTPAPDVAAVLDTAARVAERDVARRRVEEARDNLKRTRALGRELTRAWAESETSIARMRTALRELYGPGSRTAEREIRAAVRAADPAANAVALQDAVERYLAATLPRPRAATREAEVVTASAATVAAWDRAADAAAAATGADPKRDGGDLARYHALLAALGRMRDDAETEVATARTAYSAAASDPGARALRQQWRALSPADRAAVLRVIPEVHELARPPRVRGRETRSRPPGGLSR